MAPNTEIQCNHDSLMEILALNCIINHANCLNVVVFYLFRFWIKYIRMLIILVKTSFGHLFKKLFKFKILIVWFQNETELMTS